MQYVAPAAHTEQVRSEPRAKATGSARGLLYLIGIAVLVIGAIGAVAWRSSSRGVDKTSESSAFGSSAASGTDPSSGAGSVAMLPPSEDPWAGSKDGSETPPPVSPGPSRPVAKLPTRELPMPAGVHLAIPAGFQQQPDLIKHTLAYVNPQTNVWIGCAPLIAGTNDPTELAHHWESLTGAKLQGIGKVMSHGALRDTASFANIVNGVAVVQVIVTYIEPSYRLGVLVQAPTNVFADPKFKAWAQGFYASGVALP